MPSPGLRKLASTLKTANAIYGKGDIVGFYLSLDGWSGTVRRQLQYGSDTQPFRILSDGKTLKYLGRLRLIR